MKPNGSDEARAAAISVPKCVPLSCFNISQCWGTHVKNQAEEIEMKKKKGAINKRI
jgi:hypothetical protein